MAWGWGEGVKKEWMVHRGRQRLSMMERDSQIHEGRSGGFSLVVTSDGRF